MHLYFTYSESTFSYFEATRRYIELHGKPQAFYSDQYSVFRVNSKQVQGGDGHTQLGRALYELNIESICANSSQAKGRVERANQGKAKPGTNLLTAPQLFFRRILEVQQLPDFIERHIQRTAVPDELQPFHMPRSVQTVVGIGPMWRRQ